MNVLFDLSPEWREVWGGDLHVHRTPYVLSHSLIHCCMTPHDGRIRMLYDLPAELDAKLNHVCKQHKYYLNFSRTTSKTKALLMAAERFEGKLKQTLREIKRNRLRSR